VLGLLAELSGAGSTIVLITHEQDVAAQAGSTVHIRDGRLEGAGDGPVVIRA
jgi:putative ABC transport system ATP-binding protein